MSKKFFYYAGLVALIFFGIISCKTVDIRTTEVKNNFNQQLGREVLQKMKEAHALPQWDSIQTYSLHITDEFHGLLGKFSNPFPKSKADFEFQAIPQSFASRAAFKDEQWKGKVWGIQSWRTFSSNANGRIELHPKNDKTIEFWLPTYQYFIEIPIKIFDADVISYAGERQHNGNTYDLVYATWKDAKPQKDIDQYILWIDQKTHLLKQIQYTVRDKSKWIHATLRITEYAKKEGGILIPTEMKINLLGPGKMKNLHTISIENIKLDPMPKDSVMAFPELGLKGKQ